MSYDFASQVKQWIEKSKQDAGEVVRLVSLAAVRSVVLMSPVGNPELWKVNDTAVKYNEAVSDHNRGLRDDPANLTKGGRLRKGLKVNDSMDIRAPRGYMPGRFRANWQVSFDTPAQGETGKHDTAGMETIESAAEILATFRVGMADYIWFTNNVPYAIPLEYGHSTQAPNGMVRLTAQQFNRFFNDAISTVKGKK